MKLKTIIALVLILASIVGMYYWESCGREKLLTTEVLVAAGDLPSGKRIDLSDLTVTRLPSSDLSEGSLSGNDADRLVGMRTKVDIPARMQLSSSYFTSAGQDFARGQSIYVIPASWILSPSSSLRAGDFVHIYLTPSFQDMGCFEVAFVKDDSSAEILDEGTDSELERCADPDVSHVEIICTLPEYQAIYDAMELPETTDTSEYEFPAEMFPEVKLLLVQEMRS